MEEVKKLKKPLYKKWWFWAILILVLSIIGSFTDSSDKTPQNANVVMNPQNNNIIQENSNTVEADNPSKKIESVETNYEDEETQPTQTTTTTPSVEENLDTTIGENNALSKALSYLDVLAFSYSGLITQLEYEGYTHQEAVYAVDNCGADWNEQAALKTQSYLDYSAFSREGLIEQLEYEGFTREQAEYGVQSVGY